MGMMKHLLWNLLSVLECCLLSIVSTQQSCPPPDVPMEGKYLPKQSRYLPGDKIAYACKDGFTLLGKEIRTCKSNGGWSDRTPFCDRPAKIKNPRVTNNYLSSISRIVDDNSDTCFLWEKSTGNALLLYVDDEVVVHSIRIFLGKGTTKIQILTGIDNNMKICADYDRILERSQWVMIHCRGVDLLANTVKILSTADRASNVSICEIQVFVKDEYGCEFPPEIRIANGYFEVSRNKATLNCEEGYRSENSRLVCEYNSWKGLGPRCEEILCDPFVFNTSTAPGTEWIFLDSVSKISAGTRRQLYCSPGYRKVGSPEIITCQKNGRWLKSNATCIEEKRKVSTKNIVVATVGAFVAVIILTLLGITIYLIKKQRGREVVVVFKPPTDGSMSGKEYTEAEYATAYYETIQNRVPVPPTSPRPTALPPVLDEGCVLPEDAKGTLKKQKPTPVDLAFGTLKQSTLYGN